MTTPRATFRPHERINDPAAFRRAFERKRSASDAVADRLRGRERPRPPPAGDLGLAKRVRRAARPEPGQAPAPRGVPAGQGGTARRARPGGRPPRPGPDLRRRPRRASPRWPQAVARRIGPRRPAPPRPRRDRPARAVALLIGLIRVYQVTLSPLLGPACRFEPSCSRYMIGALRKYGLIEGSRESGSALPPVAPGGYDPP